jgi:hypothetical protein
MAWHAWRRHDHGIDTACSPSRRQQRASVFPAKRYITDIKIPGLFFFLSFSFFACNFYKRFIDYLEDKVDFLYFRTRVAIDGSLQYRLQSKPQAMASADEHLLINDQEEVSEDVLYVVKRSSEAFRAIAYVSK